MFSSRRALQGAPAAASPGRLRRPPPPGRPGRAMDENQLRFEGQANLATLPGPASAYASGFNYSIDKNSDLGDMYFNMTNYVGDTLKVLLLLYFFKSAFLLEIRIKILNY